MNRLNLVLGAACVLSAVKAMGAEPVSRPMTEPADRPMIFSVNPAGRADAVGAPSTGSDFVRYDELLFQRLSEAGSRSARVLASWREVEAEKGTWDWSSLDREMELCRKYRIEPVVLICNIPAWVSPTGKPAHDRPPREENAADFNVFITRMAERYKGRARYYEFWNEQNGCSWINPNCDNARMAHTYLPWLHRCYRAIKAVDPAAQVAIGGLDDAEGHAPIYLEQCYKLRKDKYGGEKFWDAVAEHPYDKGAADPAAALIAKLDALRAVAARYGDAGIPIWITEYGWNTWDTGLDVQERGTQAFLQALNRPDQKDVVIAQQLAVADFEPTRLAYGLCDLNLRPRPAFLEFQRLARPKTPCPLSLRYSLKPEGSLTISGVFMSPTEEKDPPTLVEVFDEQGKRLVSEKAEPFIFDVVLRDLPRDVPLLATVSPLVSVGPEGPAARLPFLATDRVVPNDGFEILFRAGLPWGWNVDGGSICRDGGTLGREYRHGGDHSLVLAQPEDKPKRMFDDRIEVPFRAAAGESFRIRWFARYVGPPGRQGIVLMSAALVEPDAELEARPPGKPVGPDWTELTATLAAPCDSPVLRLYVVSQNLPKGHWIVAVDDVSAEPAQPVSTQPTQP